MISEMSNHFDMASLLIICFADDEFNFQAEEKKLHFMTSMMTKPDIISLRDRINSETLR